MELAPTTLSQFVRLDGCLRFLHLALHPQLVAELRTRYGARGRTLSPLLSRAGRRFEHEAVAALRDAHQLVDLGELPVAATLGALREAGREPVILYQPALEGTIGAVRVHGRADLVEVLRDRSGRLHALVADVKASNEERLEHRVQVAAYAELLEQACAAAGQPLARVVGAVVHRGADERFTTLHDPRLHFDLEPYRALVRELVAGDDAPLQRAGCGALDELPFAINTRCDGCPYDEICLPRAAARADIALVPEITRAVRGALRQHEIADLRALAALREPDAAGKLQPAAGQRERLDALQRDAVLGTQIDTLVARARALLRRLDGTTAAPTWLPDVAETPLPEGPSGRPGMLQLALDMQADDVTGLVYLASGLLSGVRGERLVLRLASAPPDREAERELLGAWAAELETALRELAASDAPPLHVVLWDRHAQRVALEACARNEDADPLLGVLVAWLQEHPQIERATCAALRDVIAQQRNLRLTCTSLYAVAGEVWAGDTRWEWRTPEHDFRSLFRSCFPDVRRFVLEGDDLRAARPGEAATLKLEAGSRFGSQIPLEYAYAIWEGTSGPGAEASTSLPGRPELLAFAEHRLRAIEHIARACRRRAGLHVPLLSLEQLPAAAGPTDLRGVLIEFMRVEHAAGLADRVAHARLPIARRVLSGRTALLEAIEIGDARAQPPTARFRLVAPPGVALIEPRFKPGDWAVLNEADDRLGAWELLRGRLAIVAQITPETLTLELTSISTEREFSLGHNARLEVELRCRYTLDEMADDLLGDRVRETLDHLDSNPLALVLAQPAALQSTLDAELQASAEELLAVLGDAQPTAAQYEVVAGGAGQALRLVQGPPGSGKSRTLGLAVAARMLAAARAGQTPRVAVAAKTHSAAQVALDNIARAWAAWYDRGTGRLGGAGGPSIPPQLADLPILKLGGSATAPRGRGILWADPRRKARELRELLAGAVVVGGTPGGLAALLETTQRRTRWEGLFDLLLIDEASQMNLPEGLLAASVLRAGGAMIVVGDHRQMPPIVTHGWETAAGSLADWQPQRSLFKWLLDAQTPVVALDRSFRLHRDHATFLQRAIYHADGIPFHSQRDELLPPHSFADQLVDAALRHDVPLALIEHGERASRQHNRWEAELAAAIVRGCLELGLDARDGIGVVVPHRAQKAALRELLPELAGADAIDTVERFQGGERDVIVVACTASDPDYVMAEAEFLLDPHRLNVALSRARKKLVVIASSSVFAALPPDLPNFERATLWKRIRTHCAPWPLWSGTRDGVAVRVMGPPASVPTEKTIRE